MSLSNFSSILLTGPKDTKIFLKILYFQPEKWIRCYERTKIGRTVKRSNKSRKIISNSNDFRLATTINEQFKMVIFVQFTVSTLTICVNLYILMGTQITFERIMQLAIYSSCMLTQIYIFCWYGNEVKLKVYFFHDNNESNPSIQSVTSYFFFFYHPPEPGYF